MSLAAIEPPVLPPNAGDIGLEELRAVVGMRGSEASERQLSPDHKELFSQASELGNRLLLRVVEARTAADFDSARTELFGEYVRIQNVVANLIRLAVPSDLLERVVEASFDSFDLAVGSEALNRFGPAASEQAKFTTWTIRRTAGVLKRIGVRAPGSDIQEDDEKLGREFSVWLWWALFHMDCLHVAIRFNKPLRPEVVEVLVDGLRAAVNAYAIARQALELRGGITHQAAEPPSDWDDEDQALLDSSMSDLDRGAAVLGDEH